jgi:hypothetical protein
MRERCACQPLLAYSDHDKQGTPAFITAVHRGIGFVIKDYAKADLGKSSLNKRHKARLSARRFLPYGGGKKSRNIRKRNHKKTLKKSKKH